MSNQTIKILIAGLVLVLIYYLSPILTPFLLGAIIAYLANPLVKRLEKYRIPHLLSVILIFIFVICAFLLVILMVYPLIQKQILAFIEVLPQIINYLESSVIPWLKEFIDYETLKTTVTTSVSKAGWIFQTLVISGYTLIEWVINLVLTPVVMFYLLRDWDKLIDGIYSLLPRSIRPTVVDLTKQCDEVLGAFFRGQLLVMLALSAIYGVGLTLIGLKVGLVIGIVGGILSIVPYLGSIFVLVTASITALVQFGDWHIVLWVLAVYLIGQGIEGYVLAPYLIGERIGLHPVAVIFAVMAGGTLFGFFGVLLALPVAAIIMVLLRHLKKQYHASRYYKEVPAKK